MRKKKASLNLSINAIVILILAITMLGLGLTFMRGVFKNMSSKISDIDIEVTNPPTRDNQMTVTPTEMSMRHKERDTAVIAYLSNYPQPDGCTLSHTQAGADVVSVLYDSNEVTLQQDQINPWTVAVTPQSGLDDLPKTGLYTFKMTCTGGTFTKGLVITVNP